MDNYESCRVDFNFRDPTSTFCHLKQGIIVSVVSPISYTTHNSTAFGLQTKEN